MTSVPNWVTWYLPDLFSSSLPSFCHLILGGGIPTAEHSISAWSPMVKVKRRLASPILGGTGKQNVEIY